MNVFVFEVEVYVKVSKRENRLYVGNLVYDCNYKDFVNFME